MGRLDIYEAEHELLGILLLYRFSQLEVRSAALLALGQLSPQRLQALWQGLKAWDAKDRLCLAAAITYMQKPEAVPFLIDVLEAQTDAFYDPVSRPILQQLGYIGDVRALPVLTHYAREGPEVLRATAQKAIGRLMKEAQGMEEVTLVRASALSTLNHDVLLRAADGSAHSRSPEELLRPTSPDEGMKG